MSQLIRNQDAQLAVCYMLEKGFSARMLRSGIIYFSRRDGICWILQPGDDGPEFQRHAGPLTLQPYGNPIPVAALLGDVLQTLKQSAA